VGVKATFDPTVQRIFIHSGEAELDVKIDLYSDAKEDWLNTEGFSKYEFPFTIVGGDETIPGQSITPYFFLIEDWHLQPFELDHELTLVGNIFRTLGGPIAKPTSGEYTVSIDRITTVTLVEAGGGALSQAQNDQLMSLPTLAEIEASDVLAKQAELLRALGLMQENYALDQTSWTTYNGLKLMTGGRLRIYSNAGSVGSGSDVLATYLITANWTDDELDDYSVVKQ
jgi:hypothetical protein